MSLLVSVLIFTLHMFENCHQDCYQDIFGPTTQCDIQWIVKIIVIAQYWGSPSQVSYNTVHASSLSRQVAVKSEVMCAGNSCHVQLKSQVFQVFRCWQRFLSVHSPNYSIFKPSWMLQATVFLSQDVRLKCFCFQVWNQIKSLKIKVKYQVFIFVTWVWLKPKSQISGLQLCSQAPTV